MLLNEKRVGLRRRGMGRSDDTEGKEAWNHRKEKKGGKVLC